MQDQIVALVKAINEHDINALHELTASILYASLSGNNSNTLYLSLLYKLIFHTFNLGSTTIAFQLISGFIKFGQSEAGELYKPLLDYFVIEAFNHLLEEGGWAVIKPCVSVLREINYQNEQLFHHIVTCIVNQLQEDVKNVPDVSDLCFNLPREKSYTWGWFSYIIAKAYYDSSPEGDRSTLLNKQMRSSMMIYRKLITLLRQNILDVESLTLDIPDLIIKIDENWYSILNSLAEYHWTNSIINETVNQPEEQLPYNALFNLVEAEIVPYVEIPADAEYEVISSANEVMAESCKACESASINEVTSANEVTSVSEAASANEVTSINEVTSEVIAAPVEKKSSWLSSLFGW